MNVMACFQIADGARLCPQDQTQRVNGSKNFRVKRQAAAGLRHSRAPKMDFKARRNI
jgi:hypothetical protein